MFVGACTGFIGFLFVVIIPKFRKTAINKLKVIKNNFVYNGLIRSFQITYIRQCISFSKVVKKALENEEPLIKDDFIVAGVSLSYCVGVLLWTVYKL